MWLALLKDFEIYNRKLLGLTLKDRVRKSLEKAGFALRFFDSDLSLEEAEAYLIILEPILIIEKGCS